MNRKREFHRWCRPNGIKARSPAAVKNGPAGERKITDSLVSPATKNCHTQGMVTPKSAMIPIQMMDTDFFSGEKGEGHRELKVVKTIRRPGGDEPGDDATQGVDIQSLNAQNLNLPNLAHDVWICQIAGDIQPDIHGDQHDQIADDR